MTVKFRYYSDVLVFFIHVTFFFFIFSDSYIHPDAGRCTLIKLELKKSACGNLLPNIRTAGGAVHNRKWLGKRRKCARVILPAVKTLLLGINQQATTG